MNDQEIDTKKKLEETLAVECNVCFDLLLTDEYIRCNNTRCTFTMCFECAIRCENCPQCKSEIELPPELVSKRNNLEASQIEVSVRDATFRYVWPDRFVCGLFRLCLVFILIFIIGEIYPFDNLD